MEMAATLVLSNDSLNTAGILLLAVVAIEFGGTFMLRIVRGSEPATGFQQAFFRAGHAHAGVLVILSLVSLILADAAGMSGFPNFLARTGVPVAAILMPILYPVVKARGLYWKDRYMPADKSEVPAAVRVFARFSST